MIKLNLTRKQAFLTHLSVSAVIFLVISYLIVFHWYPDFYLMLDGGLRGIVTIFSVDVVLGPGLTLLVFKPGKKSLRFDMTVILLFQFLALSWGIHSVYSERSGSAVFYWGKFTCITNEDTSKMNMRAISNGPSGIQRLGFLKAPETIDRFYNFVSEAFGHHSSEVYYYADKIVPLDKAVSVNMERYNLDLKALRKENPAYFDKVAAYIKQNPGIDSTYKLVPLSCRYGNAMAVLDMHKLRIEKLINVNTSTRLADSKNLIDKHIKLKRAHHGK